MSRTYSSLALESLIQSIKPSFNEKFFLKKSYAFYEVFDVCSALNVFVSQEYVSYFRRFSNALKDNFEKLISCQKILPLRMYQYYILMHK